MAAGVAEHRIRSRLFGPSRRVRVDLHGVSLYGPGDLRTLLRWEWIESIESTASGVVVSSADASLELPRGSFGLGPEELATQLRAGRSIVERPDVIGVLAGKPRR